MLPKMDGWSVMIHLRRKGNKTPVLFLTAKDAVQERVKGLELGADDYLIKPFAFSELVAANSHPASARTSVPNGKIDDGRFRNGSRPS